MTEPVISGETAQPAAAPAAPKKAGGIWLVIIALLIFGAVGAGSYFLGWPWVSDQWQRVIQLERRLEAVAAATEQDPDISVAVSAAVEARTRALQQAAQVDQAQVLKQLRNEIDVAMADMHNPSAVRIGRLEQQVDRLLAVDRRAWLGHEAAFLLRLASQRLLVARDIDAAMALLVQADELLRATDAPAYESVRVAIAKDHANLAAVVKVDEVGLYARLGALIDQVEQLQLVNERLAVATSERQAVEQEADDQPWIDGAESSWHQAMSKLSDYLVIRRSNEQVVALMTPEWAALARQNLRMLLEQSQIAMLTANASLYQQALQRSERFTALFSQYDTERAQSILGEIRALQRYDIAPELPNMVLTRSLLDSELERLSKQMEP